MKQFIHPTLGRKARRCKLPYKDSTYRYEIGKIVNGNIKYQLGEYTEQELLARGFEEVKEGIADDTVDALKYCVECLKQREKQEDWIKKAFDYYYEGESPYAFEECAVADARIFREAIEKHMPHLRKKIPLGNMIKWYKDRNGFKEINLSPFQIIICALSDIDLLDDYNEEDLYRYRDDLLEE